MVDTISHASMAYAMSAAYGQNNSAPSSTPNSSPAGHGVIVDTVDLSPQAQQTLEQRDEIKKQEQDRQTDEILEKGFRAWAQEKYREKIEAEVRAQVLSSMGLNEEDYASLESEVQKRIQEIIEEKVREKMREDLAQDPEESGDGINTQLLSI